MLFPPIGVACANYARDACWIARELPCYAWLGVLADSCGIYKAFFEGYGLVDDFLEIYGYGYGGYVVGGSRVIQSMTKRE